MTGYLASYKQCPQVSTLSVYLGVRYLRPIRMSGESGAAGTVMTGAAEKAAVERDHEDIQRVLDAIGKLNNYKARTVTIVAVIGPRGSGKVTAMKFLADHALRQHFEGAVSVDEGFERKADESIVWYDNFSNTLFLIPRNGHTADSPFTKFAVRVCSRIVFTPGFGAATKEQVHELHDLLHRCRVLCNHGQCQKKQGKWYRMPLDGESGSGDGLRQPPQLQWLVRDCSINLDGHLVALLRALGKEGEESKGTDGTEEESEGSLDKARKPQPFDPLRYCRSVSTPGGEHAGFSLPPLNGSGESMSRWRWYRENWSQGLASASLFVNWDKIMVDEFKLASNKKAAKRPKHVTHSERMQSYLAAVAEWAKSSETDIINIPALTRQRLRAIQQQQLKKKENAQVAKVAVGGAGLGAVGGLWKGTMIGASVGGPFGAALGATAGLVVGGVLGLAGVQAKHALDSKKTAKKSGKDDSDSKTG